MKIKKADLGVALYILAAFVMFIISIPSWLLDIFLAINIGIAFLILFTVMFTKEVLDMSFYPTMLLFTTIFRIALNVSSTKLILLTGNPGNVVTTFGNYVGGGDLVVGVIIFIILILIQFMVINKGSERVAEVTARFTLDAMPAPLRSYFPACRFPYEKAVPPPSAALPPQKDPPCLPDRRLLLPTAQKAAPPPFYKVHP